jgi:hypothetical protein
LDQLGIITGIIDEIGIVEIINRIFWIDSREKVNTGEIVKAIIMDYFFYGDHYIYSLNFLRKKP